MSSKKRLKTTNKRIECPNCRAPLREVKLVNCFGCDKELCIVNSGLNKIYCFHICSKGYLEHNPTAPEKYKRKHKQAFEILLSK